MLMRIAMVTSGKLLSTQGWARHFIEIANNLASLGYGVVVITRTRDVPGLSGVCDQVRLPAVPGTWLRRVLCAIALPGAILNVALHYKCEVLLYRQGEWLSLIEVLTARLCGMRVISEVNSVIFYEHTQDKHASFLDRTCRVSFNVISEFLCYRLAAKIIAVAESVKADIVSRYGVLPEKIAVIHNGANLDISRPLDKASCRQRHNLPAKTPIIVFVGSFDRWQGLDTLVRAVDILRGDLPEVKLLLVGDGEVMPEILRAVKDLKLWKNITFVGRVNFRVVPEYIGAADICAGRFEPAKYRAVGGSPLKIAEYLACGRPVVCSRTREYWEYIETEHLGSLVPPEDPDALADAFAGLLADRCQLEQTGRRCRAYAEAHLSWRHAAMRVERVCEESLLL